MATLRTCFGVGAGLLSGSGRREHEGVAEKKLSKVKDDKRNTNALSWRWMQRPEPENEEILFRSRKAGESYRHKSAGALQLCVAAAVPQNVDLPEVLPKNRKKPTASSRRPTVMTKRKGRRLDPTLRPPANGMLVKGLIPVAQRVMEAKAILKEGLSLLLKVIPVVRCRFCSEVHISSAGHNLHTCLGPQKERRHSRHGWVKATIDDVLIPVEAYHLQDRLAHPIAHDQRFDVDRISAVDELCIQAGHEDPKYPIKRYTRPAISSLNRASMEHSYVRDADETHESTYSIQQRNFQPGVSNHGVEIMEAQSSLSLDYCQPSRDDGRIEDNNALQEDGEVDEEVDEEVSDEVTLEVTSQADDDADDDVSRREGSGGLATGPLTAEDDMRTVAAKTLRAWQVMRSGVRKLKRGYRTLACGYCPEVHVGPKGHRARVCGAFKHQQRDGRHGWQSATVDELIPPQYVWHMRDRDGPPLVNALRAFYGQAPAVVEICVQAGFPIPEAHKPMMRLDIAIPELHELDKVF